MPDVRQLMRDRHWQAFAIKGAAVELQGGPVTHA